MKKYILALVVALFTMSAIAEVQAAPGKRTVIKRQKRGTPDSQADGKRKPVAEPKVKEAPPAPEVKKSGLSLNEGESRDAYRERQRLAKGSSSEQPKKASDLTYTPQFKVGCGKYGIGSGFEKSTVHFACEGGARLEMNKKDWIGYSILLEGSIQKSPYDGFLVYKDELDYGDTRTYGDVSLGVKKALDVGKSTGEFSVGGETADGSKWNLVLKARLLSQPKDGLFTELDILTVGEPRTELKLALLSNIISNEFLVGGYAGTRMYNSDFLRHDRIGPVVRYQLDGWAVEASAEYAFEYKWGGGIKVTIPKPW